MKSGKSGAIVRLRAGSNTVYVRPENGRPVYRQQADGSWELLSAHQETLARAGVLFRNDQSSMYFEIGTK